MLKITNQIQLLESEVEMKFIRSPGPGGQNVNKVETAVQLRFNVLHSPSLPEAVRSRLIKLLSKKMTSGGDVIIKASRYRTQERNRQDAIKRLQNLIRQAATPPKPRKKTKPTFASIEKRLERKKLHGKTKSLRRKQLDI